MSDALLPDPILPEGQPRDGQPARTPWYRRRATKVTAAGIAAAGLVVGGFGVYAAASATLEPTEAIEAAFHNLAEDPISVTVTSAQEKDSAITLTHTDAGTQLSATSPEGTFEALVNERDERLYLRVDADASELTGNPLVAGMLSGFASVDALLDGQWVSVDVSQDSEALAALTEAAPAGAEPGSGTLTKAGDELSSTVLNVVEGLKEPVVSAVTDHATVTTVTDDSESGSAHYRVELDLAAAQAELQDDLHAAVDQVVTAVEGFAGEAGEDLPGLTDGLPQLRDQLEAELDKGLVKDPGTETLDLYIADEHFTKIVTDDVTLTFAADPALADVSDAVSMDDDLVRLLPALSGLMALGDQLA